MGYNTKVYRKQGGDEFVVSAGGKITVEDGGEIELDGKITVGDSGEIDMGDGVVVGIETQPEIDNLEAEDQLADVIDKVNEVLAALRAAKIVEESENGNGGG